MMNIFESLFKKEKNTPNITEKLQKEAAQYLEEYYSPPAPASHVSKPKYSARGNGTHPAAVTAAEPVSEYTVSGKENPSTAKKDPDSQKKADLLEIIEGNQPAQFQKIDSSFDDPLAGISWETLTRAEAKALGIVLDERREMTFSEMLVQCIDEQGYKDSYVYKRAQIDKRLFSKITSNRYYRPAKDTVIAFALALNCTQKQAYKLLKSAGFYLSHSSKRDTLIEYFFKSQFYDLTVINEVLDMFGEKIIGREKVG